MLIALILAQTVFYITVSLAIIIIGVLCAIVTYHFIKIAKELEGLSKNLHNASSEALARIEDIIDRLSKLPVLSYFLRKEPERGEPKRKGRGRKKEK